MKSKATYRKYANAQDSRFNVYFDVDKPESIRLSVELLKLMRTARYVEAVEFGTGKAFVLKDVDGGTTGHVLTRSTEPSSGALP